MKYNILLILFLISGIIFSQEKIEEQVVKIQTYPEEVLTKQQIESSRNAFEEYRSNRLNSSQNNLLEVSDPSGCTNSGFELNNISSWCITEGMFNGYTQSGGYNTQYNSVMCDAQLPISDFDNCSGNRFEIINKSSYIDQNGINLNPIDGRYAIKLGNTCSGRRLERIQKTFVLTDQNKIFQYNYALALQDTGICGHISYLDADGSTYTCTDDDTPLPQGTSVNSHQKPYFTVYLENAIGEIIDCSQYLIFGDENLFTFDSSANGVLMKEFSSKTLNIQDYANIGDTVTVVAEVADCAAGGHYGYAYFESSCNGVILDQPVINVDNNEICENETVNFTSDFIVQENIWTFFDRDQVTVLAVSNSPTPQFTYTEPGFYIVTYGEPNTGTTNFCIDNQSSILIEVNNCGLTNSCEDCFSFKPLPNENYILNAWVKEDLTNQVATYENTSVAVKFLDENNTIISESVFWPQGAIIDDWQQIHGAFTIPVNTVDLSIVLQNRNTTNTFFDDIRIHPFNGSMKSFVYDPITQRLMAELDENNFSTYYEYDKEGGLIRVKKETERGIYTIQETRSKSVINTND